MGTELAEQSKEVIICLDMGITLGDVVNYLDTKYKVTYWATAKESDHDVIVVEKRGE